jgi:hypothetical protein
VLLLLGLSAFQGNAAAQGTAPARVVTGALEATDVQLESGEFVDIYTHTASAAGVRLNLELTSNAFDVYLLVLDAGGNTLAEFDDSEGLGTNIRESVLLPTAGDFTLAVTSAFPRETGAYTLSIVEAAGIRKNNAAPTSPAATPAAAPAAVLAPQPGFVVGRVRMADGRPITAPNASVEVYVSGVSRQSGENLSFTVRVNPDGSYSQAVPDGLYRVRATIYVNYDGHDFFFQLDPVGGSDADRASGPGIVQDFAWQIAGPRPNTPAASANARDYYGHPVAVTFRSWDPQRGVHLPLGPADARLVFTLTPTAPLIDGSAGSVVVHETSYDPAYNTAREWLRDVPLGMYSVSGVEIGADGSARPLRIWNSDTGSYASSGTVRFGWWLQLVQRPEVEFTRPE